MESVRSALYKFFGVPGRTYRENRIVTPTIMRIHPTAFWTLMRVKDGDIRPISARSAVMARRGISRGHPTILHNECGACKRFLWDLTADVGNPVPMGLRGSLW